MLLKVTRIKNKSIMLTVYFLAHMLVYNFTLPDVTDGDAFHDLMASVMKLMAKSKNTIEMPVRTTGMTLIILNILRLGLTYSFRWSLRQ